MTSGGRFDFDDGGTYCGGWEDGKAHGHGICTGPKSNGEYAGSWNHGFEVQGVYTWPSGNTYEGQWNQGKRNGLGVENKGRWSYRGEWTHGFKGRFGVRLSTSSRAKFEGTWSNGLQDGFGTETYSDGGTYQGQWHQGMRHGLGIRQSVPYGLATIIGTSNARNFRSSNMSLRSGESGLTNNTMNQHNVDIGFDGQPVGARGGFVLSTQPDTPQESGRSRSNKKSKRKGGSKFFRSNSLSKFSKKFTSTLSLASHKSTKSQSEFTKSARSFASQGQNNGQVRDYSESRAGTSWASESGNWDEGMSQGESQMMSLDHNNPIYDEEIEPNTVETYAGEWNEDRREGLGVCERSDGFKYEGEWMNNRRHGYGRTTFPDGTIEEGKYRYNVLQPPPKSHKWLKVQANKYHEKLQATILQSQSVAKNCHTKANIAHDRTETAMQRSTAAETQASLSRDEASIARCVAKELAPDYVQPGLQYGRRGDYYDPVDRSHLNTDDMMFLGTDDDRLLNQDPSFEMGLMSQNQHDINSGDNQQNNAPPPQVIIQDENQSPSQIDSREDSMGSHQNSQEWNDGYGVPDSKFGVALIPLAQKNHTNRTKRCKT